jgi:hypothetical protein
MQISNVCTTFDTQLILSLGFKAVLKMREKLCKIRKIAISTGRVRGATVSGLGAGATSQAHEAKPGATWRNAITAKLRVFQLQKALAIDYLGLLYLLRMLERAWVPRYQEILPLPLLLLQQQHCPCPGDGTRQQYSSTARSHVSAAHVFRSNRCVVNPVLKLICRCVRYYSSSSSSFRRLHNAEARTNPLIYQICQHSNKRKQYMQDRA